MHCLHVSKAVQLICVLCFDMFSLIIKLNYQPFAFLLLWKQELGKRPRVCRKQNFNLHHKWKYERIVKKTFWCFFCCEHEELMLAWLAKPTETTCDRGAGYKKSLSALNRKGISLWKRSEECLPSKWRTARTDRRPPGLWTWRTAKAAFTQTSVRHLLQDFLLPHIKWKCVVSSAVEHKVKRALT